MVSESNIKVSESENVRIRKCPKRRMSESEKCQNLKLTETESVRVRTCQNQKEHNKILFSAQIGVSKSENVRIRKWQNQKLSGNLRIRKCQNQKVAELGNCQNCSKLEKCQNSLSALTFFCFWHFALPQLDPWLELGRIKAIPDI